MRRRTEPLLPHARPQQGFVLVTAVIFIFVLSTLAVMAMRGSMFDERMSANDRDVALAREFAEMALRDAERDILGLKFDGTYCAQEACATLRPASTRPVNEVDATAFWTADVYSKSAVEIALLDGGASESGVERKGVFTADSATACGKPVWSGVNWEDNANPARTCAGSINDALPSIAYGTFTDAPFLGADGNELQGIPRPRYIIEVFPANHLLGGGDLINVDKFFFRITAVGFGRTSGPRGRTSVTLQSVFSPL